MREVLVNHLFKLAQEKSVVRLTEHPRMTIAVAWDVKQQTKPKTPAAYIQMLSRLLFSWKQTLLRAISGTTSHIEIFLILCIQLVLCMDCQFMK